MLRLFLIGLSFLFLGCSSLSYRPILYSNAKYKKIGREAAEKAVDQCLAEADRFLEGPKAIALKKRLKRSLVTGGIVGGVAGLATTGKASGGAGGAALGGGALAAGTLAEEASKDRLMADDLKVRYVTRCLNDKGLEIIGWM